MEALRHLEGEGMRAALIKGAGGEGKSTILMQIALELLSQGYRVYYILEPDNDSIQLLRGLKGSVALLIDQAQQLHRVGSLLRFADGRGSPTKLVLAARANEWDHEQGGRLGDTERMLKQIWVGKLNTDEAYPIAEKLVKSGAVSNQDVPELAKRLLKDTNGFLLLDYQVFSA
jgi:hypothetical protein